MHLRKTISALNGLMVLVIILSQACSNEVKKEEPKEEKPITELPAQVDEKRFPNKRSELAVLMRTIYDDLKANKEMIADGGMPDIRWTDKFGHMKTATPTDAEDSGPVFEAFADKFMVDLANFETSTNAISIDNYNNMIQSCLDCHQEHCHGPMEAIGKLKI